MATAPAPAPAPTPNIFELTSKAGVQRDGTGLASQYWQDAQWVRFQRGLPRKMGGYRLMSNQLLGPIRGAYVDSRGGGSSAHTFSAYGVEKTSFDQSGTVTGTVDRTPSGFASSDNTWQVASMFQSGGSAAPLIIACSTPDLASIASDTPGPIYSGDITAAGALTQVEDSNGPILVSGGLCMLQPFLFGYGSNGLIRNSNPNDISNPSGWDTSSGNIASSANVAASKIVKGMPMRGGSSSPSGLFWSLDALIRVTFIQTATGTGPYWQYDTLTDDMTVLSKSGIVEYDNVYYWLGTDRFYMYTGIVQELPNKMNLNWLFDNLNFLQRQKVWAMKVPRWGEIWWFFPSGMNTECDKAVIWNVREQTWYDAELQRTSGFPTRVFNYPLMAGELVPTVSVAFTQTTGAFSVNEQIVGGTSGAVGTIARAVGANLSLTGITGTFVNGETLTDTNHGGADTGSITADPVDQFITSLWQHEYGTDRVSGQETLAIQAFMTSNNFQWMDGGLGAEGPGINFQTRLTRVEPDFVMAGDMTLRAVGSSYAQSPQGEGDLRTFNAATPYIDLRDQQREIALYFESNVAGGTFEMGRVFITAELGDEKG